MGKFQQRTCPNCGDPFITMRQAHFYCSKECREEGQRCGRLPPGYTAIPGLHKHYRATCLLCGRSYEAKNLNSVYCSVVCVSKVSSR